jgi:hypothetical protein
MKNIKNIKPAHTPGPWEKRGTEIVDKYGARLAECPQYGCGVAPEGWVAPWYVAHENACLIAAAPDLLEACRQALGSFNGRRPSDVYTVDQKEFDLLTTAISKAEGKP